jgi:ubiquinone/menaquinone biosynthesis C-methylase UbiE
MHAEKRMSSVIVNAQYNVADAHSIPARLAKHQRRKMFRAFLRCGVGAGDTILDIGATSDRSYDHSNYLEAWYPWSTAITAVGIDPGADFIEDTYPGVRFVQGNGCMLPFADDSFDYVHSSAVIEHVGSRFNQMAFIAEARRVARKGVFITTPNRWFPVEFHTVLPLVHWLPRAIFRRILAATGRQFFADEANLNLLSGRQFRCMARHIGFKDDYKVGGVRLGGIVSNVLFVLRKDPKPSTAPLAQRQAQQAERHACQTLIQSIAIGQL